MVSKVTYRGGCRWGFAAQSWGIRACTAPSARITAAYIALEGPLHDLPPPGALPHPTAVTRFTLLRAWLPPDDRGPRDDASPAPRRHHCPRCDGSVYRVRRRLVDLLLNVVVPVRRYRCRGSDCGWEGNLRRSRGAPWSDSRGGDYDGSRKILEASRLGPGTPDRRP